MVIAVSVVVVVVTFARKTSIDGNNDACVCVCSNTTGEKSDFHSAFDRRHSFHDPFLQLRLSFKHLFDCFSWSSQNLL